MLVPTERSPRSMSAGRSNCLERLRLSTHDARCDRMDHSGGLVPRSRRFFHRSEDGETNSIQSSEPQNNQTPARMSGGSSRRDYANETRISLTAEVYPCFTASCYTRRPFLASAAFIDFSVSPSRLARHSKAFPASPFATALRGSRTLRMGADKRNPNPSSQYIDRSPPAGRSLLSKWARLTLCVVTCVRLRHAPRLATMCDSGDPVRGPLRACRRSQD